MKSRYKLIGKRYHINHLVFNVIFAAFFLLTWTKSYSQTYTVKGIILEANTNKPIIGATVKIKNSKYGDYSNIFGEFNIPNINKQKVILQISHIAYESIEKNINLSDTSVLKIYLIPKVFHTKDIVVTASRRMQNVQEVTNSVFVLDNKSMQLTSSFDFEQILTQVPGIEVADETISIRGSDGFDFGLGSRNLLLLDGLPLISADNGDAKLNLVPISTIESVEIVKGAGSALYGSSAIGGVINIVTKKNYSKKPNSVRMESSVGIYTEPRFAKWRFSPDVQLQNNLQLSYSYTNTNFSTIISGRYYKDESYRKYDDGQNYQSYAQVNFKLNKTDVSTILLHQSTDRADWVYWHSLDSATYPPAGTNLNARLYTGKSMIGITANHFFSENWLLVAKLGGFYTQFWNNLEKTNTDYRSSNALSSYADLQLTVNISPSIILTAGSNFTNNNVASISYGLRNQKLAAGYFQAEIHPFDKLITTIGARYDAEIQMDSSVSTMLSPKLGFNFTPTANLHLRGSVGKGFRAPAIAERYASVAFQGFKVVENPNLTFEESWNYELGFNFKSTSFIIPFEFDISGFYNRFSNLIEPSFVDEFLTTIKFSNITNAEIKGLESSLNILIHPNLILTGSYTYLDPIDLNLNEILKFRSRHFINSSLNYKINDFAARLSYRYSSIVERIDEKLIFQVKDAKERVPMNVFDLNLSYNIRQLFSLQDELVLKLNCYNLFDYYYTYMVGNLARTRLITFGIDYRYE